MVLLFPSKDHTFISAPTDDATCYLVAHSSMDKFHNILTDYWAHVVEIYLA